MYIEQREVVIVGAEPGGLQMAYYLQRYNVDYVICEASDRVASFLEKYPITSKSISFDKKYNCHQERSYNLRGDWNSLFCENPELDFTNYTDDLYPDTDILLKYLQDYLTKNNLNIRFNSKVRICLNEDAEDESSRFSVIDTKGQVIHCRFVMLATGAVAENVPQIPAAKLGILDNLPGREACLIGAGVCLNQQENYLKKRNSPNVIRLNLGAPLPLASGNNKNFTGDVRSKDNDGWQLEILNFGRSDSVAQLTKKVDGHIQVMTPKRMSLGKTPRTKITPLINDTATSITGFNFVDPSLFDGFAIATRNSYNHLDQTPKKNELGRFPSLSSWGETSVSGIYYIGAAGQVNDSVASSLFIRNIRYRVRSLFAHLQAKYWSFSLFESVNLSAQYLLENHNGDPLPTQRIPCSIPQDLLKMAKDFAWFYSLTDSLPAMPNDFGDVLIFDSYQKSFKWWHDQPLHYILNAREKAREFFLQHTHISPTPLIDTEDNHHFLAHEHVFILTMEANKVNYPQHLDLMDLIKSADRTNNYCSDYSSYLRPAIRYFHLGSCVSTLLIQESLSGRFVDQNDEEGFNDANTIRIYNYLLSCLGQEFFPKASPLPEKLVSSYSHPKLSGI